MKDDARPWLTSYDKEVKASLDYEEAPLFVFLDRASKERGRAVAIAFHNLRIRYARLKELAETAAANLKAAGLRKGDRVAIMLPNSPQAIISYFGALKAGAVPVMINPLYMSHELSFILEDSGASFLIVLDLLYDKHKALLTASRLTRIYVSRMSDGLAFPLNLLFSLKARKDGKRPALDLDNKRTAPFKALVAGNDRYSEKDIDPRRDLAALQYTGGTTGRPKGVMLTHFNLAANVSQSRAMLHAVGEHPECFLGILPYFHVYGLTVCVNFAVACGAVMAPIPRFVPAEAMAAINKTRPTVFPGAPAIYNALMRQDGAAQSELKGVRFCISGSAPMPLEASRRFSGLTGAEILEGYGLTEASPITHLNPLCGARKPGSIGIPFPDTLAAAADLETGEISTAPGATGELVIKGPQVMLGYWNRPEETGEALKDGWLHTGDVVEIDEDGYFFILDRKKDLILSGGYNVYPREVEEVLLEHPAVKEAVVIGVPSPTRGETVKAFIIPEPGTSPTKQELTAFARSRLAGYKAPRQVEFREDFPRTLVGKVLRRALREEEEAAAAKKS